MPAVGLPVALGGLLVCIWLLWTEPIWYPAAIQAIDALPGALAALITQVVDGFRDLLNTMGGWMDNSIQPLATGLWSVYWTQYQRSLALGTVTAETAAALYRTYQVVIPRYFTWATQHADQLYNQAAAYIVQVRGELLNTIASAETAAFQHADQLYNRAAAYIVQVRGELLNTIAQDETAAFQHADQLYNRAAAYIVQVRGELLNTIAQDEKMLEGVISGDQAALRQLVHSVAVDLTRTIESVHVADLDFTRTRVAAESAARVAAFTQAQSAIRAIESSECMKFCNVLGGIGSLLQNLELAGLLALLAEAYVNPGGAVDLIRSDVARPAENALGDVLGLFGIKAA